MAERRTTKKASAKGEASVEAKSPAELRKALRAHLGRPAGIVMLSRDRIEEALDEAVKNGQITAKGARTLAADLVKRGRKQTDDVLGDLEQLLGRGRDEIGGRTSRARKRAAKAASPALAKVDKARRAAGVGPNFPILEYDELNVAQVQSRLSDLTPAQLRKVRDHEKRNANRKTILNAIEKKLGS